MQAVACHPRLLQRLQRQAAVVRRLGSVCSSAWLLAHAGLLDGRRVTTHWNISASLAQRFEQVQVEHDQTYLRGGNLYTSAGVTADMDLAPVEGDLTVDQLAAQAGMSVRNFSRAFKSETGETPADFVEAARLDAARRLLATTGCAFIPSLQGRRFSGCGPASPSASWPSARFQPPAGAASACAG
ncbi:DJ-1/PfpI family protein [Duganella sp. Root1480D1]|uniref:DJ-1/PfpI family protein n=1 Tax=Duganella sp. Root1480D1 TaxID=1736471 RepID=UPI001E2A303B|nr:helix-turn-helix domain-containing protein [Duganella sp. Root1480D1]